MKRGSIYNADSAVIHSSIILLTVSGKLISMVDDEKPTLTFIRDYLESRIALLKSIEVSNMSTILTSFPLTSNSTSSWDMVQFIIYSLTSSQGTDRGHRRHD